MNANRDIRRFAALKEQMCAVLRQEWTAATARWRDAQTDEEQARQAAHQASAALHAIGTRPAGELSDQHRLSLETAAEQVAAAQRTTERQSAAEQRQASLQEAHSELKALEKLSERQQERQRQSEDRTSQVQADQHALRRGGRPK